MTQQSRKIKELESLKEEGIILDFESPILTDNHIISILKNSISEFQSVVTQNGSDDMFREVITSTIKRIEEKKIGLDTEDKEAVCLCFEKMMDAVELTSSGGILNTWLYGFNPEDY